jgi:hypothetical protein
MTIDKTILLMVIGGYFINGHWWFFFLNFRLYYDYRWLFYYKLLLDIFGYIIIDYW